MPLTLKYFFIGLVIFFWKNQKFVSPCTKLSRILASNQNLETFSFPFWIFEQLNLKKKKSIICSFGYSFSFYLFIYSGYSVDFFFYISLLYSPCTEIECSQILTGYKNSSHVDHNMLKLFLK